MNDGRSRRAVSQRAFRKAALLTAAQQVFSQQGYHATSITDIVRHASVARGTFYQYFDSKKEIFLELLAYLISELQNSIVGVDQAPDAPPLEDQLIATVYRIFTVVNANRSITTIVFREAVGLDQDVDRQLQQFYSGLEQYIVTALRVGQRAGSVRHLHQEVVANCIVGSMRQVAHRYLIDRPEETFDAMHISQEIVRFTLQGVVKN